MRNLRAERWLRQRWLGTALGALSLTLAKASPCFAASTPAAQSPVTQGPVTQSPVKQGNATGSEQRAAADCAKTPPAAARQQGKAEESSSVRDAVTVVAAGVGVAGLSTGIVYELLARSNNHKAAQLCRAQGGLCMSEAELERHRELARAGDHDRRIGLLALSVGGAALVTTAILLVTGHAQAHPDDAPELSVGLSDSRWGATLSGRF